MHLDHSLGKFWGGGGGGLGLQQASRVAEKSREGEDVTDVDHPDFEQMQNEGNSQYFIKKNVGAVNLLDV